MRRAPRLGLAAALAVAWGVGSRSLAAAEPTDAGVRASMACERAAGPGRLRCTVEAKGERGHTIAWADVVIVALPDFASPLRGRLGPQDATAREAASYTWAFGLVAKRAGQGEVHATVRLVVCEPTSSDAGPPRCTPLSLDVRAPVVVGS